MPDGSGLVVYEWRARQGYLAASLFPAATFLSARSDDNAAAVLDALPAQTTHFLFHLGATITSGFPSSRSELLAALKAKGIRAVNERAATSPSPSFSAPWRPSRCPRCSPSERFRRIPW